MPPFLPMMLFCTGFSFTFHGVVLLPVLWRNLCLSKVRFTLYCIFMNRDEISSDFFIIPSTFLCNFELFCAYIQFFSILYFDLFPINHDLIGYVSRQCNLRGSTPVWPRASWTFVVNHASLLSKLCLNFFFHNQIPI